MCYVFECFVDYYEGSFKGGVSIDWIVVCMIFEMNI